MTARERSREEFQRAQSLFPGGVSSPVRAFRAVDGEPPVIVRGSGPYAWDRDGNRYVDLIGAYGPLVLGQSPPKVVRAVRRWLERGLAFGMPTRLESTLGAMVRDAMPAMEMMRFVSSGTEAAMSALRLARAATGRDLVLKFDGCYHGHADGLLVRAGSGVATLGLPGSAGVPEGYAASTLVARYNDVRAVEGTLERYRGQVAAVIVEPVAANMGVVPPAPGYLEGLRDLTRRHGALLIFDEVITGFRVARGGAQERYGVRPDLVCLGKIVGGGMPVGVYGGRRDLMELVAPLGAVYQAGTLSGSPPAMVAGIATLSELQRAGTYERLEEAGAALEAAWREAMSAAGLPVTVNRVGSLLTPFVRGGPVRDYDDARASDLRTFATLHAACLEEGVLLPPSQFEAQFVSLAHGPRTLDEVRHALRRAAGRAVAALAATGGAP